MFLFENDIISPFWSFPRNFYFYETKLVILTELSGWLLLMQIDSQVFRIVSNFILFSNCIFEEIWIWIKKKEKKKFEAIWLQRLFLNSNLPGLTQLPSSFYYSSIVNIADLHIWKSWNYWNHPREILMIKCRKEYLFN